ncbi:MAG: hypothetical protein WD153_00935, partial [Candidatus Paceibacterota bacterium]
MNISVQSKIVVVIGLLFTPLFLVYGQSGNTTLSGNVTVRDSLTITGSVSKGSGTFVIDHPLDPEDKLLYHSFVESPDAKNIYDGVAVLDKKGRVKIKLPKYLKALNTDFRYLITPIGTPSPNLHIQSEIKNNQFTI